MVKIQEAKSQFWITIPKLMIKKKGWKKGQELLWSFNQDGNLVLMEI